jgi:hypothetical protein
MSAGKSVERRNWKSPSQRKSTEEPAYDGYTPETEAEAAK